MRITIGLTETANIDTVVESLKTKGLTDIKPLRTIRFINASYDGADLNELYAVFGVHSVDQVEERHATKK